MGIPVPIDVTLEGTFAPVVRNAIPPEGASVSPYFLLRLLVALVFFGTVMFLLGRYRREGFAGPCVWYGSEACATCR